MPCPRCGGKAQRIFSPVPIIFKGSGFYATDSRGNHNRSSDKTSTDETKAASTNEAKAGSTNEAKTASTNEAKAGSTEKED